ncbi:RhoGAP-domain-containing protein [Cucurbitaria berberidis CBS 394.84]|uniref:RhoGAP-domain-containing protein n=1 Tax=Cucurbitaria berberidis CBS 394.84 TaxID=1168544 RepID=A0A9P4GIU7_9PLEO|nr:RhoGAP-domain-containing protein [Cucurbitaria berberidis CBS 394.84]KAF1846024.1 RhoGAP-domain-containing protein [Cucurbitaria berberidis CBS 394.84]
MLQESRAQAASLLESPFRPLASHDVVLGHRKAVPSPLPPSGTTRVAYHEEPRSPREKLDALLAEEEHHHRPPPTPPNFAASASAFTQPTRPSAYAAQLRHTSSPTLSSSAGRLSPPASPVAMPPPSRPHRPETRPAAPVRNASIDSAASSLSSSASQHRAPAGHAYRPSQDTSTANPPDMDRLIAAAGSPEAALLALWKEKQSTASHNAQLWRLVEKQRSMIIGLQKDLERALKDKDRYRKKVKDFADQVPPVPGALHTSDTFTSVVERDSSQSPALSERPEEHAKGTDPRSTEHKSSPLTQEHHAPHLIPDSQLQQSPSHSSDAYTASNPASASSFNSPTDYSVQPLHIGGRGLGLDTTLLENGRAAQTPEKPDTPAQRPSGTTPASSEAQLQPPQISLIQATPVIGGEGFESPPRKPVQPLRKAPPTPLNLSKPVTTSAHLHQAVHGNDEDSDYDDTLEVDEIPIVEQRGRRKTREEDDRVREAMYSVDEAPRSKSKKKKSESKSKQTTPSAEAPVNEEAAAVPLSPRLFNPLQAGLPLSPRHPPASSLNALLSPTNSDSSMVVNRSVASIASPLMSPGLPSSPRPGDRPLRSPLPRHPKQTIASPPLSPSAIVHPPRTFQQPVPLLPNTPQSDQSTPAAQTQRVAQPSGNPSSNLLAVPNAQPSPDSDSSTLYEASDAEHVYRGLVSDQYPGLLLPPNALPSIEVKVFSSRLRPSRLSFLAPRPQEEDPVFILAVYARSDNKQLWRVEKTIATLPTLDSQLRSLCDFQGRLPDRALFGGHAPAKIDARRVALNQYFDTILETPMTEKTALIVCDYLSMDVIGAQAGDRLAPEPAAGPVVAAPKTRQRKEGYLTKRGKNFGGWKARFFVLDGPEFRYYESEGGAHLGTIKLQSAQIGKQSQQQSNQSPQRRDDSEDNQYRHAFLILEPKRKDSTSLVRHVLCAENDEERDAWVEALLQHVDYPEDPSPMEVPAPTTARLQKQQPSQDSARSQRKESPDLERPDRLQGLSYDDTVAAEAPMRGPNHRDGMAAKPSRGSPKMSSFSQDNLGHYPSISGPSNGTPIKDVGNWGNKLTPGPTAIKDKKRSIFGFRARGSSDLAPIQIGNPLQTAVEQRTMPANRSIFGIPLQEAVEFTQPAGVTVELPAVVYRCLEYLREKQATSEEGIFRLSGSNIVIKGLRDRFNTEGDIRLLEGQYYDVHAVASLLKLYLRELPASILTRELHLDFLKVLDMDERGKKIQTFNVLVHKLPTVNFELLRHLSSFLIEIVENSGVNKMTVRNVGIVFAPTLNIPAPLISFFLTDYADIFGTALDEASSPIHEIRNNASNLGDDAIRSPRRQMFSDLPTPAYNETTFQQRFDRQPPNFQASATPSYPPPQPPQQQQQQQQQAQYSGYESGFIPIRPIYETPAYEQPYQGEGYGSLNGAIQTGTAREQRQRRRESGMLLMNMGMGAPRKGSNGSNPPANPRMEPRATNLMVQEETAFD